MQLWCRRAPFQAPRSGRVIPAQASGRTFSGQDTTLDLEPAHPGCSLVKVTSPLARPLGFSMVLVVTLFHS